MTQIKCMLKYVKEKITFQNFTRYSSHSYLGYNNIINKCHARDGAKYPTRKNTCKNPFPFQKKYTKKICNWVSSGFGIIFTLYSL